MYHESIREYITEYISRSEYDRGWEISVRPVSRNRIDLIDCQPWWEVVSSSPLMSGMVHRYLSWFIRVCRKLYVWWMEQFTGLFGDTASRIVGRVHVRKLAKRSSWGMTKAKVPLELIWRAIKWIELRKIDET